MNSGGGDVKPANVNPADLQGQPAGDIVADAKDDPPEYNEGFPFSGCPDNNIMPSANTAGTTSSGSPGAESNHTPQPTCDTDKISGIPYNVFHGSDTGSTDVYGKFCDALINDHKQQLNWIVDAAGNRDTSALRHSKRTPPPNPSAYSQYSFELNWKPSSDKACSSDCQAAFASFAISPCGHQGGQQNVMAAMGSVDVGCGTYSYNITERQSTESPDPDPPKPPKPTLGRQYCFPSDAFGDHGDIHGAFQKEYISWACSGTANLAIKKDDPSTFIKRHVKDGNVPYNYTISWEPGCTTDVSERNAFKPLPNNDATCFSMLRNDYKKCESPTLVEGRYSC